ncbi:hypothetical protein Lfu02_79230 [Longispora fulva]|uniref:Aspartyl/asparaginy/proline hydroxylase domain-containing protein n=1 Tax=Longispora fulva TaxID=619741 RepID=A0A8J7GE34_9ACTN|nr:aspartyl/asparaginyl beta-hydroxylase domain-containing protein [Longispora fulva]MBG6134033.1 hypothetical protein [Longispora fulva]GIG63551.1 hypothetical protein Lfu02_79230 [Longispora fulva]
MATVTANAVRLLPEFDARQLQEELFSLGGQRFSPQATYSEGEITESLTEGWRVLSLRSPGGDPSRTDAGGPGLVDYADTPYLEEAPYTASVLRGLGASLRAVRFMSLEPGAAVGEHTDHPYGLPVGWARLHLPIVTNDQAVIVIEGVEHRWQPGELWYANFGRPHHLYNHGPQPRVHLVIDVYVTPGLLDLFPADVRDGIDESVVMFQRPEVRLSSAELEGLSGSIPVPENFLRTYPEPPTVTEFEEAAVPDSVGDLRAENGRLVLRVGDRYETVLVHLGGLEFRPLCWTEERTMRFTDTAGTSRIVFGYRHGGHRAETVRQGSPS